MLKIWKFTLDPYNLNVDMPQGAKILTAREQGDNICIWAEVDQNAIYEKRFFEVFGTGDVLPTDMATRKYIGTALLQGGGLVFHIYEKT